MTWLSHDLVATTAFRLLAASSPHAYIFAACKGGEHVGAQLNQASITLDQVLERIRHLWSTCADARQRLPEEVELALLLVAVARNTSPAVERELLTIGLFERPATSWLASLSRWLVARRPANSTLPYATFASPLMSSSSSALTSQLSSGESEVTLAAAPQGSTQQDLQLAPAA